MTTTIERTNPTQLVAAWSACPDRIAAEADPIPPDFDSVKQYKLLRDHTGEWRLVDAGAYVGPRVWRNARPSRYSIEANALKEQSPTDVLNALMTNRDSTAHRALLDDGAWNWLLAWAKETNPRQRDATVAARSLLRLLSVRAGIRPPGITDLAI